MTDSSRLSRSRNQEFSEDELIRQAPHRRFNWTLLFGLLILLGITLLAAVGPQIAPRDPLEENFIIKVGDKWDTPPFRIFTEGFPLGSDQFGRDIWSRLLWAIRPTLIMVAVVGVIRLFLGVLIGLFAGWSDNWFGRFLNNLIEFAVSIPVLLVALGAIALIGPEYGIWSFVIGLSLTGWVETSQQVREQTRIIRKQTYVEAARALGSNKRQILGGHIVRQILPMILMLFAFELSNTLMTTAGLGFLGYYIGGDVWIATASDFVSRRISGMPELGQMLATSWAILTQPWGMVAVGSMIFITVLGFNLVGEGLRAGMNLNIVRRRSILSQIQFNTGMWLDEHVYHPLSRIFSHPLVRGMVFVGIFLVLFWFGGVQFVYPHLQNLVKEIGRSDAALAIAMQSPTPKDQEVSSTPTPEHEEIGETIVEPTILWEIDHPQGFATGLAISRQDGQFYAGTRDGFLIAYDLEGNLVWQTQLTEMPFESVPVVDRSGTIYVADQKAGLTAINSNGEILWHFVSDLAPNTVAAPVLTPDGVLFYVVSDFTSAHIQAISTSGESLWSTDAETSNYYFPLSISLDGKYLFHREDVVDTQSIEHLKLNTEIAVQRVIGGLDGNNYALSGQNLIGVDFSKDPPELLETTSWNASGEVSRGANPQTTPSFILVESDGTIRMMYTSPGGDTTTYWHQIEGQIQGAGMVRLSGSLITALNSNSDIFLCGGRPFQEDNLSCALMKQDLEEEAWRIRFGSNGPSLGGFELNNRYYFSTAGGKIYVIQEVISSTSHDISEPQTTQDQGIVWSYPYGKALKFGPMVSDDGTLFLIDSDNILTILNQDGTFRYSGELPKPLLRLTDNYGYTTEVHPTLLLDTLVVLAEDNTVYALAEDGSLAWEFPLEHEALHYPTATSEHIYIFDREGILYAFDLNGLHWSFVPEGPNIPTGSLAVASDGRIFFGLTDPGKGYIQALTNEGSPIWNIQTRTDFFYDQLEIAGNEEYLFLNDDIYQLDSGELIDVEFPFPVHDQLAGNDGKLYFRSANSLMHWQPAGNEVEILHTASLDDFVSSPIIPYVRIDENSLIWVYQFRGNQTGFVWMDVDGNVVGRFTEKQNEIVYELDDNPLRIGVCTHSENILSCGSVDPVTEKFTESASIAGVDQFLSSNFVYHSGFLYILTNDRDLIKIYINE